MKPAFSVLIFTVTSGAGYGLLIWMLWFQLVEGGTVNPSELLGGGVLGLTLITIGLLSSTLHLANPKNAWRAFNRFRTSWLSREGVFALTFYPLVLGYAAALWTHAWHMNSVAIILAILAILNAFAINISTGMIYASLKPIRQWHNPLTAPLYVLFSLMSGALLLIAVNYVTYGQVSYVLSHCFLAMAVITAITKWCYLVSIGKPAGATINSATTLGGEGKSQASVRLLDAGHSADTFLTNEFGYDAGAQKLINLRRAMAALAFLIPIITVLIAIYFQIGFAIFLAIAFTFSGVLIERWLFFAEARHVVRLYHGDQRT